MKQLHPETKRGTIGAVTRWNATATVAVASSFVEDTAMKTACRAGMQTKSFRLHPAPQCWRHVSDDTVSSLRQVPPFTTDTARRTGMNRA
jgi:hypothetical protein